MRWSIVAFVLALATPAVAAPAQIAVLPWTAPSQDLEPYGRPLAHLVARRLSNATKLRFTPLTSVAKMPRKVLLVIDGRVVSSGDDVRLEARVRDPARGEVLVSVVTEPAPLEQIEKLAIEVAAKLASGMPTMVQRARQKQAPPKVSEPPARPQQRAAARTILIPPVSGSAGLYAATRATPRVMELAKRLGFEPVPIAEVGALDPSIVRARMEQFGAQWALLLHLDHVKFTPRKVLTARGVGQFILYDRSGTVVFDRKFETDTVVGSRGDSEEALVRFVAGQLAAMAEPVLRKRLR